LPDRLCLTAFMRARCLPRVELGPVDFFELLLLISSDDIGFFPG
jgi:hypothetical protein